MYICLASSIVLLGFGIYGFVFTPSSPSEILNTQVTNRDKSRCDPSKNEYNAAVLCESDNTCQAKCMDATSKCVPRYIQTAGKMEEVKTCIRADSPSTTSICNPELGGELILQPANDGKSMNFGCQCRYPNYTSENPNSNGNFCQLLPSVCNNGEFNWDARKTTPENAECKCSSGYVLVNNVTGIPTCIQQEKLGSGTRWNPKTQEYENLPIQSGVYPCVGDNNFC